jgi:hypothetical protein
MGDGVTASRASLDTAARQGMEALKVAWAAVSGEAKRRIGGNDGCPEAYKAIARKVDAERERPEPERVTATEVRESTEHVVNAEPAAAPPPIAGIDGF